MTERIILSARNDDVNAINTTALDIFPGEKKIFYAADKMLDSPDDLSFSGQRIASEYLNTLEPAGLPPFALSLKYGSPIMLLRNIAPKDGLCNGTRLKVLECKPHCIFATILTGEKAGDLVFIPRISLTSSSNQFTIEMTRRQFPVRLAYAMTINKSQGQSVKFVGIDLRTKVFSHGQLYVALSRCTSPRQIYILQPSGEERITTNIIYPEVLI